MKKLLAKIKSLRSQGYGRGRIAEELGVTQHTVRAAFAELEKLQSVEETILIKPDSHACCKESNKRFDLLGKFTNDRRPSIIVDLGDHWDMESLSSFDKGKASAEGNRYINDIDVGIDAMERFLNPLTYNPRKVFIRGNHEYRIIRAANSDPALVGTLGYEDLQLEEMGWEVCDYKDVIDIEGIAFTHHFTAGRMDKPISGVDGASQARNILTKVHMSAVQGHSHVWGYAEDTLTTGKRIFAIVAGCFFEKEVSYASKSEQKKWSRGVTLLHKVITENGVEWDVEKVSIDRMRAMYG